jgi:hypothetical protein
VELYSPFPTSHIAQSVSVGVGVGRNASGSPEAEACGFLLDYLNPESVGEKSGHHMMRKNADAYAASKPFTSMGE